MKRVGNLDLVFLMTARAEGNHFRAEFSLGAKTRFMKNYQTTKNIFGRSTLALSAFFFYVVNLATVLLIGVCKPNQE
jgi:preprotein translocase subunit SecG